MLWMKSSKNNSIFLPEFHLIMWIMKALKNLWKIIILETRELVSFWGVKTHFGEPPMKWCIFRDDFFLFQSILCRTFWSNQDLGAVSTSKWLFESHTYSKQINLFFWIDKIPSRHKLCTILEDKMSENWSYEKIW